MNEYKFRAWLIHEEEMCQVAILDFRDSKAFVVRPEGQEGWRMFSEINLQQYSPFNDKSCFKICEGDIIRYSGSNGCDDYEIIVKEGCFITRCITKPENWNSGPMLENSLDFETHWKIIGNRHLNRELLKERY